MSDKSGQFIKQWKEDVKQRDATIAKLTRENAELRGRVERAIVYMNGEVIPGLSIDLRKEVTQILKGEK